MTHSPFPGMDPYLEAPDLWPDVHSSLMNIFRELLSPQLAPEYAAELETQLVVDRVDDRSDAYIVRPDVTVKKIAETAVYETSFPPVSGPEPITVRVPQDLPTRLISIKIRHRDHKKLVTVIELLSPVNKRNGKGRQVYIEKRSGYLSSPVHLVEIDLLRMFPRMPYDDPLPPADYLLMICRRGERPDADVWPVHIRQRLPTLPIPLLDPDPPAQLDVEEALRITYQRARYDLRIDYRQPPEPPLAEAEAEWAKTCISRQQPTR
ncbi:MAG: DUF4058 family protein [Chloroflexi bacterium]|nr:DUF4058 family protein [Chloroflexota bacterium]